MVATASITAAAAVARRLGVKTSTALTRYGSTRSSTAVALAAARHGGSSSFAFNGSKMMTTDNNNSDMNKSLQSCFSSATKSNEDGSSSSSNETLPPSSSSKNQILPTKHSRNMAPPIAPHDKLSKLTTNLLSSTPGTLFSYDSNDTTKKLTLKEEKELAIQRADVISQTFEYVLHGHSALLVGSIADKIYALEERNDVPDEETESEKYQEWMKLRKGDSNDGVMTPLERASIMNQLLERIEEEGKVYVEMRSRHLSQVANVDQFRRHVGTKEEDLVLDDDNFDSSSSSSSSSSSDSSSDSDNENDSSKFKQDAVSSFGTTPGPTIAMYDLVLDALALTSTPTTPSVAKSMLLRIIERHELDGGYDNTNPLSIPTALSYNAVIRCCANVPIDFDVSTADEDGNKKNIYVRDAAIDASFVTFDAMLRSDVVERNSATYDYLIRAVTKLMPTSRTQGNIIYALYTKAREEGVYSEAVRQALMDASIEDIGEEFAKWFQNEVKEKDVLEYPQRERQNSRILRYQIGDDTY